MNTFFWILWWVVVAGTLVLYYFFFIGLADGSVSGFNGGMWMAMVIGFPALLMGTYWLKNHGWIKLSLLLLAVPALPLLGYLLFIIAVMAGGPGKWN